MIENLGNLERTHSCGALRKENAGERVTLMGWCGRRRDFGPLTFVDLRDRDGITQVVVNQENARAAHAKAKDVRGEYVLAVTGEVVMRDETARNPKLATGDVEVQATEIVVLNDARTLPFQLDAADDSLAAEDLRLKYRYLDLRRPQLQANLRLRHRLLLEINRYMDEQGFTQIETPNLIKSTPEGARDYIVPSRVQPGKFFALPQSPQIFKQICMIAGLDKYYQIARCFRDEDLRADRQPEFSQLDIEMSFATPDQIYRLVEGLFASIFRLIGVELQIPFPRFTFAEVMRRFGSDKPDLRIDGMELQDLSATLAETAFAPYASILSAGGQIKGMVVGGGASMSRKTLDELQEFAKRYGAGALAWIKLGDELSSSLLKALGHDMVVDLAGVAGAGCQREHAGTQQLNDVRRVGGGEFVGLDEVPGDRDAEGDGADDRGAQVRIGGGDGLGDLRLVAGDAGGGGAGGLGVGQHRAEQGQRRPGRAGEPLGERGEDLLGGLRRRAADLRDGGGVDHPLVQLLLGPEVVHDQARVHSCGRGHGPDGGPVVPGGEEGLGGGVEDAGFGAAALLGTGAGPGCGHGFILRVLTGGSFHSTIVQ